MDHASPTSKGIGAEGASRLARECPCPDVARPCPDVAPAALPWNKPIICRKDVQIPKFHGSLTPPVQLREPSDRGHSCPLPNDDVRLPEERCRVSQPVPLPPPGFDELDPDEKLDYLESLWDRVSGSPDSVPLPEWHVDVLRKRLAAEDEEVEWSTVRSQILERLRKNRA